MVRTPTFVALCAALAASATSASATWNDPQLETIEVGIDRLVFDEALPLHQLAGLGPQYAGRTLQSIKVKVTPFSGSGEVQLLVDGQVVSTVATTGLQAVYLFPDPSDAILGAQVQTIEVRTIGAVAIDDIEVNVGQPVGFPAEPEPQPEPQTACLTLEHALDADVQFTRLNVGELFDLSAYADCRVESISIVARSATGNGRAMARLDGWQNSDWAQISALPGQYTFDFWSDPMVGANAPDIALSFLGIFNVQSVRLTLIDA